MARHGSKGALTLASLPDDALQEIIAAFVEADSIDYLPRVDLPGFEDVKGLGCTSKGMRHSSSIGCSLSWAFRISPPCSAHLIAHGASRCCMRVH